MPDVQSEAMGNVFFVGDLVRTRHGSWSQEKAFVTGIEAANAILGRPLDHGVIPLGADEAHVAAGRSAVSLAKQLLSGGGQRKAPSLVDFLW
uniref:Amine oxidase domain-containing protein n=1 Tax=Eutreptiella gymnastica TaxID=73025 RepID=A0A7S1NSP3_9EUGL